MTATFPMRAPGPSRLASSARTLLAKAETALAQTRVTNTRRRADMAANAVGRAEREALRARVALAIAEAGGKLGPSTISSLKDLELLESELCRATGWLTSDRRTDEGDATAAEKATFPAEPARDMPPHAWEVYKERVLSLACLDVRTQRQYRETLSAFVALRSSAPRAEEDPVRALERRLVGFTAPGFFPTPRSIAAQMVELAAIGPGTRVLEPSAGSGRLADAARARGGDVLCVEINVTLSELLRAKGHTVMRGDFLDAIVGLESFDAIVMNPPFEDGYDAVHVRRAFDLLKPGGRLVAVTSEGAWFREERDARHFRVWVAGLDLFHDEKLPSGTFNHSDVTQRTGVSARLIGIRKAAA